MIYVVIEELIPEAQSEGHGHLATIGAMLGFCSDDDIDGAGVAYALAVGLEKPIRWMGFSLLGR